MSADGWTRVEVDEKTAVLAVLLGLMREAPDEPGTYELTEAGRKWLHEWVAGRTKEATDV